MLSLAALLVAYLGEVGSPPICSRDLLIFLEMFVYKYEVKGEISPDWSQFTFRHKMIG